MRELARVLRPGGMFIARTISRHSILAAAARVVPNDHHAKALEHLQPGREERDVFRTAYKMNTRKDLARLFDADFDLALARRTGLEQYCKPWPRLRRGRGSGRAPPAHLHVDGARRLRPPPRLTPGRAADQAVRAIACPIQDRAVPGASYPMQAASVRTAVAVRCHVNIDACSTPACSSRGRSCGAPGERPGPVPRRPSHP